MKRLLPKTDQISYNTALDNIVACF